jgi:TPR repeat protein
MKVLIGIIAMNLLLAIWMASNAHAVELSAAETYAKGQEYLSGTNGHKNREEAFKCILTAAQMGYAPAQYDVGNLYDHGIFVEKDEKMALDWYRKAADQGNADAQYSLGVFFAKGIAVNRDPAKAVEYYRKSADRGNALATYNLAIAYFQGDGTKKDEKSALALMESSALKGFDTAQYNLGAILYRSGARTSMIRAYAWMKIYLDREGKDYAHYAKQVVENILETLDAEGLTEAEAVSYTHLTLPTN